MKTKLNKTNLSHWSISIKIFLAMKLAIKSLNGSITVFNRKGKEMLTVQYWRSSFGSGFVYFDNKHNNVTELVLSVIRTVEV